MGGVMAVVAESNTLTHADRCDRCGSRAYVVTVIVWSPTNNGSGELFWCRHHWLEHQEAISHLVAVLIDETAQLFEHVTDDGHVN
jgi:hypothetical protein